MIGVGSRILPNVKIGSNVIIGAGSIVSKVIPDNSVAVGIPCRVLGNFNDLVEKMETCRIMSIDELLEEFYRT